MIGARPNSPFLTSIIVTAALLAACGGPAAAPSPPASLAPTASVSASAAAGQLVPASSSASPALPSPSPAGASPSASSAAPAATPAPAKAAATLRYNIGADPASIDPAQDQDTTEDFVITQISSTLVQPDKNLNVTPGVAASWDISPDGLTYTFHLRPSKWSDGTPLTARDFEYSFKRLFDPANASPYTDIVNGIKGSQAYFSSKSKDAAVLAKLRADVGVKAMDDSTLVITLKAPEGYFLSTLFNGATAPVNRAAVKTYGHKAFDYPHFVGNGPFKLAGWAHNSKMELVPNPDYWGSQPKIDLNLVDISTPTAMLAAYKNNEIDVTGGVNLATPDIAAARADPALSKQLVEYPELGAYYLQYNVRARPFNNPKVRQAIGYAIDRKTLVDKVLGGVDEPASSLVPPGMPGHINGLGPTYDVGKASSLLAQAGYPNGRGLPPIRLSYAAIGVWGQVMQFVQADLKAIGVEVKLNPRDPKTYFSEMRSSPSPIFQSGWNSDYPDPNDWYGVIFLSSASQNYGHWSSARYDRLVKQAAVEPNMARRLALYRRAAEIMVQDPPATMLFWPRGLRLVKPYVKGLQTTSEDAAFAGKFFLKDVTIAK
ncbi:MAG: peptide ABC transporter substrate-binding protein [Chloroflexota bacterium]